MLTVVLYPFREFAAAFEAMFFLKLVLVLVTFVILRIKFQKSRTRHMVDKFEGPPVLPFLGNILMFVGSPKEMFKTFGEWHKKSRGEAFRLWMLHKPCIVVTSLEDIRIVSKVPHKDQLYKYLTSILGDGLITTNGQKWRRSRRLLDPLFSTPAVAANFLNIFNKQSLLLAADLECSKMPNAPPFDVWPYIFRMSLQTIYETAVGSQIRVNNNILNKLQEGILKACHLSFKRCYQPWLQPNILFKAYLYAKGYNNVFHDVMHFHQQMIADKKRIRNESNARAEDTTEGEPVIDALLAGQQDEQFTDEDIANEIITLLFAGTETSSVIICFTLMMLAAHPDAQQKVYAEIRETIADDEAAALSLKQLFKLTYLDQCIKETMRKFSIVSLLLRQSPEDITLKSGAIIPAGVTIAMSPYLVHHNAAYYPNPSKWDPSNFDADKVAARPAYTFIPFGTGPRTCLGNRYGMISMKITLAQLLRRFQFSTTQTRFKLDQTFMTRCANGYHLRIRQRRPLQTV